MRVKEAEADLGRRFSRTRRPYAATGVRMAWLALLVALMSLSWTPLARADEPPRRPDDVSAINAYRESVPSSGGNTLVGVAKERAKPLPRRAKARLVREGGTDTALLDRIATSSQFGAPQRVQKPRRVPHEAASSPRASETLAAASKTLAEDGGRRLLLLLVGLFGITGVATFLAVSRARRSSS